MSARKRGHETRLTCRACKRIGFMSELRRECPGGRSCVIKVPDGEPLQAVLTDARDILLDARHALDDALARLDAVRAGEQS